MAGKQQLKAKSLPTQGSSRWPLRNLVVFRHFGVFNGSPVPNLLYHRIRSFHLNVGSIFLVVRVFIITQTRPPVYGEYPYLWTKKDPISGIVSE
jgi:hypothetical protein